MIYSINVSNVSLIKIRINLFKFYINFLMFSQEEKKLFNLLKQNGKIFVEIGKNQEKFISKIGLSNGLLTIDYGRDLQGIIRIIVFTIK